MNSKVVTVCIVAVLVLHALASADNYMTAGMPQDAHGLAYVFVSLTAFWIPAKAIDRRGSQRWASVVLGMSGVAMSLLWVTVDLFVPEFSPGFPLLAAVALHMAGIVL